MAGDVIKEFLVSLGFQIEAGQERKFTNAIGGATKSAVALGAAVAAASSAVSAAVVKIGRSLDSLYWQAQRVNTTVGQIRSAAYAVSQLGGSVDGARSSIEGFGKQLKWNPGFEGYIRQLGVVTRENGKLRDSTVLAREFAQTIAKLPLGVQKAHAELAGMDLPTLEALQNPDYDKHVAKQAEAIRRLGVDQDAAARKANALVSAMTSLNDAFTTLGTLLVDRLGPSLTDFFQKVERFLLDNSENIVAFFEKLGKVAGELAAVFEKLLGVIGPLWQKFDNLTQSIAGTDGLTVALLALIGLKVAPWLLGVAAAITKVGTAASVALLGGALGKFLRLFGVAGAVAMVMDPTEANAGEDQEIARRRAAGTFGPAKAGELEADAAKRQQGSGRGSAAPKDTRSWYERWAPKWAGGKDAPERPASTAPIGGTSFDQKAPGVMRRLMEDFELTKEQAAGIVGNLGHESGGFKEMQEKSPVVPGSRGGYGWAQWTGPRRRAFEAWAAEKGLDPASDEANYGFLKHELKTSEKGSIDAIKRTQTAPEAMQSFEGTFERSGIKNFGSRQRWTDRALKAFDEAPAANQATPTIGSATAEGEGGHQEAYRRKTGRDLQADLNSKDPYVRDWAAKEAGFTPTARGDEGAAKMPNFGDRVREADRQNEMGRQQSYENSLPKDGDGKSDAVKMPSFGDKVREADRQTALGKVQSWEDALPRAADNAAKVEGGGIGGNGSALTPPPASTAGTNITINQENHTSVTGSGDPHDTAQRIGQTQKDTNAGMVRDLKGAVR